MQSSGCLASAACIDHSTRNDLIPPHLPPSAHRVEANCICAVEFPCIQDEIEDLPLQDGRVSSPIYRIRTITSCFPKQNPVA